MCYPIFTITLYLSHAPNTQKIQYNTNANAYTRESYARDDRADMQQSWMELILPIHRASVHVSTHTRPYPCAYRTANAAASTHVHTLPIILWLFNAIARARAHTLTHPVYFVPHNHVCVCDMCTRMWCYSRTTRAGSTYSNYSNYTSHSHVLRCARAHRCVHDMDIYMLGMRGPPGCYVWACANNHITAVVCISADTNTHYPRARTVSQSNRRESVQCVRFVPGRDRMCNTHACPPEIADDVISLISSPPVLRRRTLTHTPPRHRLRMFNV